MDTIAIKAILAVIIVGFALTVFATDGQFLTAISDGFTAMATEITNLFSAL